MFKRPIGEPHSAMDLPELPLSFPVQVVRAGQRKLSVSIKRLPGREPEVTFGLEQIELPDSELEQQAIFDKMTAELVAQHQHFINAILPRLPRTFTTSATTKTDEQTGEKVAAELQIYTASKLVKNKRPSGKIEYKIITTSGRYSQYGIVVSLAQIEESGLVASKLALDREGKDSVRLDTNPNGIPVLLEIDERGKYPVLVKITGTPMRPF